MARVRNGLAVTLLFTAAPVLAQGQAAGSADIAPYEFARSYLSQLATFAAIRKHAAARAAEDRSDAVKAAVDCADSSERYDREAGKAIAAMEKMELSAGSSGEAVQAAAHEISENYKSEQGIARQLASACSGFAKGPKSGANSDSLAATMAKLRSRAAFIDQLGSGTAMMVFAALMSDRPDPSGHITRLAISCAQKKNLLGEIDSVFGPDLGASSRVPEAVQARSIRDNLAEYQCADER